MLLVPIVLPNLALAIGMGIGRGIPGKMNRMGVVCGIASKMDRIPYRILRFQYKVQVPCKMNNFPSIKI